jgi:hypothetical protein
MATLQAEDFHELLDAWKKRATEARQAGEECDDDYERSYGRAVFRCARELERLIGAKEISESFGKITIVSAERPD